MINRKSLIIRLANGYPDLKRVEKVKNHRKQFHQWGPLRIYISLGEIKKPKPKFSLRFLGQEVGNISVEANEEPMLLISPTHDKHNQKYFAKYYTDTADKFGLPPREYEWNSPESIKFRKDFKEDLEKSRSKTSHSRAPYRSRLY